MYRLQSKYICIEKYVRKKKKKNYSIDYLKLRTILTTVPTSEIRSVLCTLYALSTVLYTVNVKQLFWKFENF